MRELVLLRSYIYMRIAAKVAKGAWSVVSVALGCGPGGFLEGGGGRGLSGYSFAGRPSQKPSRSHRLLLGKHTFVV